MGSKGSSSKTPAVPDAYKTAIDEASINRLDTYNPGGGGIRYGYTDAAGNFVSGAPPRGSQAAQSYIESDTERRIRELLEPASVSLTGQVVDRVNNLPAPAQVQDFGAVAQQIYDTGYKRMSSDFEKENQRLLANLQARGLPIGGEAFNDAYESQQRSVNDALAQLSLQSTLAAGQEQSRQFGLDTTARSNAIAEIVAAMGGGYSPQTPQPSGQAPGVDYSGLVQSQYQAKAQQAAQAAQSRASNMSALGSIAGAAIMKSDRRAKTDVVRIGQRGPLSVYAFRYIGERAMRRGYMAQEVAKVFPAAIRRVGAWLALDYSMLPEV